MIGLSIHPTVEITTNRGVAPWTVEDGRVAEVGANAGSSVGVNVGVGERQKLIAVGVLPERACRGDDGVSP